MFGFGSGLGTIGKTAAGTSANVGAGYGEQAQGINSTLLPFLTRELNNPEGYSQQQRGSMLNEAEAGAGGSTAGLNTEASLTMARNRNSGGFSGGLDEAARIKDKALSANASGIASKDADLQQSQRQSAASGLQRMGETDTQAQLKAMGLIPDDINATVNANQAPWKALTDYMAAAGKSMAGGAGG